MIDVSVDCRSTPLNVNKQIFKKFPTYVKNIVQIHKWQMATPDYLMIDLKSKGGPATPTRGDGRLIVYGITGTHNDVSSSVLDTPYVVENGKMVMETDLDLNGKRLLNYNPPKSKAVILGNYSSSGGYVINGVIKTNYYIFGFDFTIKKITFQIISRDGTIIPSNTYIHLTTRLTDKSQKAFGVSIYRHTISYLFDYAVGAGDELFITWETGSITRANIAILIEI